MLQAPAAHVWGVSCAKHRAAANLGLSVPTLMKVRGWGWGDTDTNHTDPPERVPQEHMQSTGPSQGVWKSFGEERTLGSRSGGPAGINQVREEEVQRSHGGAPRGRGKIHVAGAQGKGGRDGDHTMETILRIQV